MGVVDRGGQLEVEVNQARGLTPKPGSKNIPGIAEVPSVLMVFFFFDASELHSVVFLFSFFCSNICEGVPAGERRVCG